MGLLEGEEMENEWDFEKRLQFARSSFIWNKHKTKLRILIIDKQTLIEWGYCDYSEETRPEELVLREFNGDSLKLLKEFICTGL